ncbi:MAG: cadherin domain-containing protein [Sphingorhabdus sp.]
MATFYNILGSQTLTGGSLQDRFYAFTYDQDLNNIRADATVVSFSWTSGIRSSATSFFTITGSNVQTSSDFFAGGEKDDSIYGSNLNDAIFYNNGSISGGIGSFSSVEIFSLGAGDDIIDLSAHGTSGIDYAKNVTIHGDAGNDIIIGGAGIDTLYGDEGNDLIFGYRGADTLYGGAGNDTLYGDDLGFNGIAGDDFLYGQAGDDFLYGGARTDRLEGGDGNDTLYGGAGGDTLLGGANDDILYGDDVGVSGNDKLYGDAGNDQLFGGDGSDEMRGGTGNDLVDGGNGNDFLDGDDGNDILVGGAGNDTIDGGIAETDTAVYSGNASDYTIVLNADGSFTISDVRSGSPDGIDTVNNVEFFQFADGTVPAGIVNYPPVITSNGGGASASLSLGENSTTVTTVTATDADAGQVLTYSIVGGADAALFAIDPATGVLTFIAAPDFENPGDFGGDNVYDVIVQATDNIGAFDQQALSITVSDVAEGAAPVITSNGGGATAAISIDENSASVTTVEAFDDDGTTPIYSIVGGADAALFSIDPQTGALVFITAPDFEAPADFNGDNIYDVIVQASDGLNNDQQQIAVTVGNLNDNAPVITSGGGGTVASFSVTENGLAVASVAATDADGTTATYSIVGGADAALFSIDPQTGALVFITAPDFEAPADFNSDNIYDVIVQASDGLNIDQQQIAVTVGNVNDNSPVITSNSGGATAAIGINENSVTVTTVAATDADGTAPTYSIVGGADAALFSIDPQTGTLVFITAPDFEAPADFNGDNIYDVIVQASDGTNTDQQEIAVTVGNLNDGSPVITSNGGGTTASIGVAENSIGVTIVESTDADGPAPTYSIVGGADAALFSIDPQTGALVFITAPDFEAPADLDGDNIYDVIVQASDGSNLDQQQIAITVGNLNDNAPVITSGGGGATATANAAENQLAVTIITAVDADGTAPTYSIVGGADAALFSIDPQTGALVFNSAPDFETPGDADLNGIYDVIVRASDGSSFDDQTVAVTVTDVAEGAPPVITSNGGGAAAALNVAENDLAVTTVTANDPDGTVPTYMIIGGADAALFTINAQTGALAFTGAPDFETPLDADLNGVYEVIVRATDGTYFDDQTLSVTVTDVIESGKTITGSSGNNVITPTATNPALQTTAFNDTIYALAGNDIIDGGGGADYMEGGVGDDIYYVDQFSDDGNNANDDLVIELAASGTDLVNSTVSYILTANVENLTLIGAAAINGTGNDLGNIITGNGANNILTGGLGDDTLNGGTGADIMDGGAGNDIYFVDTYSNDGVGSNDDQVIELAGGGTDMVNASVSYVLANEVENLTLTGAGAIDGTGNALANILTGNSAANTLLGLDGADTLNGGAGDDVMRGGNGNDTLNGGNDNDSLYGDAGADNLFGNAGNDLLDGGAGTDTLSGQAGMDILIGGLGRDSLTGGTESDTFRFNFGETTISSSTNDAVTDFVTGTDKIDLDFVGGSLAASAYSEGAISSNVFNDALASAQTLLTAGKEAVFVAGTTDGWLFWDTNHDGIIDQSILLKGLSSLGSFDSTDII